MTMAENREQGRSGSSDSANDATRGEYVHGGTASTQPAEGPGGEGQYVQGDYGAAGAVEGVEPPTDDNPTSEPDEDPGQYPEGDYGPAGSTGASDDNGQAGQYDDGDYGSGGTVRHDK
jgi:hypothetical protein